MVQFFVREYGDCSGWAVQDGFGGGDGVASAGSEGDELAATVVGMVCTLNKPMLLSLSTMSETYGPVVWLNSASWLCVNGPVRS